MRAGFFLVGVKLPDMKNVHLVIADLFLPKDFGASAGLHLPALEKILARGTSTSSAQGTSSFDTLGGSARTDDIRISLEDALCELFRVSGGLAPIAAAFDGLEPGCWLRADPVHVRLQREQVVLLPNVVVSAEEATLFCASLNEHFNNQGIQFFAPHPSRWYVRLDTLPEIISVPLSQAAGRNIHGNLPKGKDEKRWRQLFNEIQMLLFAHPVNEAREARCEVPVNSVWFWGEGSEVAATTPSASASSDEILVKMLASAAKIPFSDWQMSWQNKPGDELLIFTGLRSSLQQGDLSAWRNALQDFETGYAQPLWQALRAGKIAQLKLDVLGADSMHQIVLTRADTWAFWRGSRRLADVLPEND